jgi:pyrophosphatase PpaX
MSVMLTTVIVITGFLALYWVFYGQRKYNEMFTPAKKVELKAVLFDLDGVILDSFEAWYSVFNHVRKDLKLKEISREEFRKKVWGGSVQSDAKNYYNNSDAKSIEDRYRQLISEYVHKTELLPDTKKVLDYIKKKNIKIGLVTNTFRETVQEILKFHNIDMYFDAVVTSDDVEKSKPYPDPVIKICEKLNVFPQESILVGDTKNDYKAGKAAGCLVIGLNTRGDLIISSLNDLLQVV